MVNVQDFLLSSGIDFGTYTLVTYNNKTEPTWFTKYNYENKFWFLESPCQLYKVMELKEPVDEQLKEYVSEFLDKDVDIDKYINEYVKPMIVNNVLFDIENFQCSPYLPKYAEDIKLISERECLEYMLKSR